MRYKITGNEISRQIEEKYTQSQKQTHTHEMKYWIYWINFEGCTIGWK